MGGHGGPWWWRRRGSGRGRKPKPRFISFLPKEVTFIPYIEGVEVDREPIMLNPDELEALRLVYYLGLTQDEAAKRMEISRGTLWRLLSNGRRKIISALIEGRPLIIASHNPGVRA